MFVRLWMTYHSVYNYFLLMYFMSYVSIKFYIVFIGGALYREARRGAHEHVAHDPVSRAHAENHGREDHGLSRRSRGSL